MLCLGLPVWRCSSHLARAIVKCCENAPPRITGVRVKGPHSSLQRGYKATTLLVTSPTSMNLTKTELNQLIQGLELAVEAHTSSDEVSLHPLAKTAWWKAALLENDRGTNVSLFQKHLLLDYIAYLDKQERQQRFGVSIDIERLRVWFNQKTETTSAITQRYLQRTPTANRRAKHIEHVTIGELRARERQQKRDEAKKRIIPPASKPDIVLTFKCEGPNCSRRLHLHKVLEQNRGFPVIICPKCGVLLEVSRTLVRGGDGHSSFKRFQCEVRHIRSLTTRGIPPQIVDTIKEAISCYATKSLYGCVAMCRRVVEGIVVLMNAKGKNLKEKIDYLGNHNLICTTIVLPSEHRIRSLGNIACHFDSIKENEITEDHAYTCLALAYEISKEIFCGLKMDLGHLHGNQIFLEKGHDDSFDWDKEQFQLEV
jgi:hypothetical protein